MFWPFNKIKKNKLSKKEVLETEKDKELFEQLEAAFGEQKALSILDKVKAFKCSHSGRAYTFIFDELGNFKTVEKKKDLDNDNE